MNRSTKRILAFIILIAVVFSTLTAAYAAPTSYSSSSNSGKRGEVCTSLSGTGASSYYAGNGYDTLASLSSSALLTRLRNLMTSTHTRTTSYSDCKNYATKTDCEENDGRIVMIYTSYSGTDGQYSGGSGWNREHVWPKALGGFNTSGAGADLHHIRPSENRTNSNRGSLKYGNVSGGKTSTGNLSGEVGGYYSGFYEPVDSAKGDVARIILYMYVRYGNTGSYTCGSITKVFQSVDVLLDWCELDPVDTWEMGRNEVVEGIQGNRNVFIDYPELAWLLFDKEIPSDMTTPSGKAADGSSTPGGTDTPVTPPTCTHASTELRGAYAATCAKAGYSGDKYCKSCGELVTKGTAVLPTGNHTWGAFTVVTPPTATEPGLEKSVCSVCSAEKTATIPPLGSSDEQCSHEWGEEIVIIPPTATEPGEAKSVCTLCGDERVTALPPTGEAPDGGDEPDVDEPVPDELLEFIDEAASEEERTLILIYLGYLDGVLLGQLP
ncbi:MAG: endonuclease [Clostridia bacterium]|nr:endonuclease [Clostridia bacterium]